MPIFNVLNWIVNRTGIYHMEFYENDKIQCGQLKLFQIWTNVEPKSNAYEWITRICVFLDWNEKLEQWNSDICQGRFRMDIEQLDTRTLKLR